MLNVFSCGTLNVSAIPFSIVVIPGAALPTVRDRFTGTPELFVTVIRVVAFSMPALLFWSAQDT